MSVTNKTDRLGLSLERLSLLASIFLPELQEAVASLISAFKYRDKALVDAGLNSVHEALRAGITKLVEQQLGLLEQFRKTWQQIIEEAKLGQIEDYDALGSEFQYRFDEALKNMASLHGSCVRVLREPGYPIELEADLKREMEALKALREKVFVQWPWSSRPMPPLGFERIGTAKKASLRGEGESIDDLVRRLTV